MTIRTTGRTDLHDYFEQSGIREYKKLNHTPFLAFCVSEDTLDVRCIDNAPDLLLLPDATPVMAQWQGQWRSDFFQFTVGDLRRHVQEHPRSFGVI